MVERETSLELRKYLPEIDLISSEVLRAKVEAIWAELWEQSRWQSLDDLKVSPEISYPHIPHNRSVVQMALAVAGSIKEFHGIEVDRDLLIAGALLQDASKVVETVPTDDGRAVDSELGSLFPHAFWVTHVALIHGLPHELCEVLLDHTPQSARFPKSLIGKILYYVDQIDVIAIFGDRWRQEIRIAK